MCIFFSSERELGVHLIQPFHFKDADTKDVDKICCPGLRLCVEVKLLLIYLLHNLVLIHLLQKVEIMTLITSRITSTFSTVILRSLINWCVNLKIYLFHVVQNVFQFKMAEEAMICVLSLYL